MVLVDVFCVVVVDVILGVVVRVVVDVVVFVVVGVVVGVGRDFLAMTSTSGVVICSSRATEHPCRIRTIKIGAALLIGLIWKVYHQPSTYHTQYHPLSSTTNHHPHAFVQHYKTKGQCATIISICCSANPQA